MSVDEYDPIADHSISVTLPFTTDEEANTLINIMRPDVLLLKKINDKYIDNYC